MLALVVLAGVLLGCLAWLFTPGGPLKERRRVDPATDYRKRPTLAARMAAEAPATGKHYVVVGTGSLGSTLLEALVARGEEHVTGVDIKEPSGLPPGVAFTPCSVLDPPGLRAAVKGADVCFNTVAYIGYMDHLPFQKGRSMRVNVEGTKNLVEACVAEGVPVLVHTSSAAVATPAGCDISSGDEACPYVSEADCGNWYNLSKALSEQILLEADGTPLPGGGTLRTACVRPGGIFGHRDTSVNLVARHINPAKKITVACAGGVCDYVSAVNVAWAELLVEKGLADKPHEVGGQAFCVTTDEAMTHDDFNDAISFFHEQFTGEPLRKEYIPPNLVTVLANGVSLTERLLGRDVSGELAALTRGSLHSMRCRWRFTAAKARRVLGYSPVHTFDESMQHTVEAVLRDRGMLPADKAK